MQTEAFAQFDWFTFFGMASPLLVLLATGVILVLRSALVPKDSWTSAFIAATGLAAAAILTWRLWPCMPALPAGMDGSSMMMLSFDRISAVGWLLSILLAAFAILLSIPYFTINPARRADYYALLIFATFGMCALVASSNLVSILIALETMSVAAYALTGYFKDRASSVEGAFKYFLMGAFATAFFAMGLAFILGSSGSTDIAVIAERAGDIAKNEGRAFFLFGMAMITVAFAFKAAIVPFHAWAPDAYDGAPTPISAFMATGIKAAAFIAFFRFAAAAAPAGGLLWHNAVWALAIATMFGGNIAALWQNNLKRMLAYSSIAHAGYILTVFPSLTVNLSATWSALILYLAVYAIMTMGAFAILVALEPEMKEPVGINSLAGLARRRPVLAAAFALFLVSLAGFPPTLGFFGKYYLFLAAVKNGDVSLVVAAVVASVISVFFYLRPVVAMYFTEPSESSAEGAKKFVVVAAPVVAVIAIAALAIVAFGILPQNLVAFAIGSVN